MKDTINVNILTTEPAIRIADTQEATIVVNAVEVIKNRLEDGFSGNSRSEFQFELTLPAKCGGKPPEGGTQNI